MELKNYQELIGKLTSFEFNKDGAKLKLIIEKNITIPNGKISKDKLDDGLNQIIGILRIDDDYRISIC